MWNVVPTRVADIGTPEPPRVVTSCNMGATEIEADTVDLFKGFVESKTEDIFD